ncbi:hypothetical protein [Parasitella parasitica]|uniref:C2H2-type domain-containing protein n=1 Tax=Parasitella parasitica TaxID=35722 RepID=A0A0B7NH35_9FUNG|nr:hypothetical protein [Parasitella parasitica]
MGKVNTIKTKSLQCEYPYCSKRFSTKKSRSDHYRSAKHAFPKEEATENAMTSASTDEIMELDEPASDVEENNPKERGVVLNICIQSGDIAPTILFQDTLDAVLKKKLPVKYDDLNVCHNGCIVFSENMSECDRCKKDNPKSPKRKSKTMKMLNIGSLIATMLCDKQTRELMEYPRNEFQFKEGEYTDIFSGEEYQRLSRSNICKEADLNIYMGLYIDGFENTNVSKHQHFSILHLLFFNFPPHLR